MYKVQNTKGELVTLTIHEMTDAILEKRIVYVVGSNYRKLLPKKKKPTAGSIDV